MRKMIVMAIAGFLWRKFMARRATTAASGPALTRLASRIAYGEGHLMPSSCAQCGAESFPQDTGWTACADCLARHLEWLMGVGGRERMPMKRPLTAMRTFGT